MLTHDFLNRNLSIFSFLKKKKKLLAVAFYPTSFLKEKHHGGNNMIFWHETELYSNYMSTPHVLRDNGFYFFC